MGEFLMIVFLVGIFLGAGYVLGEEAIKACISFYRGFNRKDEPESKPYKEPTD